MDADLADKSPHPFGDRIAGTDGFVVAGARYEPCGGLRPHCPVCFGELIPAAHDGPARFRHASTHNDERCPLSTLSYQPDGMTVRRMRDVVREREQRGAFIANWQRHYQVMRRVAPFLTIRRFIYLIGYADVLNLWSYPALEQADLPYVLLVLAQFMRAGTIAGKPVWVRFCFDATVRDVGDLWTHRGAHRGAQASLFRMLYGVPDDTPFPTSRQLIHYETVRRDTSFLETPEPYVKRAEAKEFQRFASTGREPASGAERADTGTP